MDIMKNLLDSDFLDERMECEECGEICEVVQLGRRWCSKCWKDFSDDYQQTLPYQESNS